MKFLKRLYDIRKGEELRVALVFTNIFLIIASLMVIKPIRNSLFLTKFGASQLPYAYMLVAFSAAVVASLYAKFSGKLKLNRLILITSLFSIGSLVVFWLFFQTNDQPSLLRYLFYVWVAIFGMISTSQVWLLANYVFNAREARRLFPLIGAGAIAGGIAGGYLTRAVAPLLGTVDLLLIAALFLIVSALLQEIVWRKSAKFQYKEKLLQQRRTRREKTGQNTLKLILSSRHLTYVSLVVGLGVVTANFVDYQFNAIVSSRIADQDELTAFFGFWLSNLSVLSLLVQLLFTGRVLSRWGVGLSLFFLPLSILGGAVSVLFFPGIWSAVLIKLGDGGFKHSIHRAGLELLILPVPARIKNQVKTFIDVSVDSLATGISGILLLVLAVVLGFSIQQIAFITILWVVLWLFLSELVKKQYVETFRTAIEKRTIDLELQTTQVQDASVFESLMKVLQSSNERQVLYVLTLLEHSTAPPLAEQLKILLSHPSTEIKMMVLKMLKNFPSIDFPLVEKLVRDPDPAVRVHAMEHLVEYSEDRIGLLKSFLADSDYRIQCAALVCASKLGGTNEEFKLQFQLREVLEAFATNAGNQDSACTTFVGQTEAQAIGLAGIKELYPRLLELLHCPNLEVRREAILSARMTQDPEFIQVLISQLQTNALRKDAREALGEFGDSSLPELTEHFRDSEQPKSIRLNIPRVLALIGSQKSADLLFSLLDEKDLMIRYEVLKSLNNLRVNFASLKFNKESVKSKILKETKNYYKILTALYQESHSKDDTPAIRTARKLLIRALTERLDQNLERIFRLLGLSYKPEDILSAYKGILSQSSDLRANAIEFLDNILDPSLKKQLLPIVETTSFDALVRSYNGGPLPSEKECLNSLLDGNDNWLKVCAMYLISQLQAKGFTNSVASWKQDPDAVVAETANMTLERLVAYAHYD